jgi:hypothetical protein
VVYGCFSCSTYTVLSFNLIVRFLACLTLRKSMFPTKKQPSTQQRWAVVLDLRTTTVVGINTRLGVRVNIIAGGPTKLMPLFPVASYPSDLAFFSSLSRVCLSPRLERIPSIPGQGVPPAACPPLRHSPMPPQRRQQRLLSPPPYLRPPHRYANSMLRRGTLREFLMTEVDPDLSTIPLAAYCFMTGWMSVSLSQSCRHR